MIIRPVFFVTCTRLLTMLSTAHEETRGYVMTEIGQSQPVQTRSIPGSGQPAAPADPPLLSVWEIPVRGTRGPTPRHDRAAIASAAVRIADAEYLDANLADTDEFMMAFQRVVTECAWGYAWSRPGLDRKNGGC